MKYRIKKVTDNIEGIVRYRIEVKKNWLMPWDWIDTHQSEDAAKKTIARLIIQNRPLKEEEIIEYP